MYCPSFSLFYREFYDFSLSLEHFYFGKESNALNGRFLKKIMKNMILQ